MVITFLTDFGLTDDFVGVCRGVMKRISPQTEVIDITHGIPPQAVLQGALEDARMRQRQFFFVQHHAVVVQKIDVDRPRPPADFLAAAAAKRLFRCLHAFKQSAR